MISDQLHWPCFVSSIMEDHFLSFPTLLCLIIFMSLIIKVGKRFRTSSTTSNLPPGPWKLPFIGSIHHLINGDLPHRRLRELSQKYGPIMHLQLGETPAIVVSSPQIAKEVFKTHNVTFANRPRLVAAEDMTYGYINISFSPYGDYWRLLRKICAQELLSTKCVRSFQSIREEEVSNIVRYVSMNAGSSIDLTHLFTSMTFAITARAAFGEKCKDQEAYVSLIKEILSSVETVGITNFFPSHKWLHVVSGVMHKLKKMHRESDAALDNIIKAAAKKTEGDGSLLSVLLNLKDHGAPELTMNSIKAIVQDIYIAGGEPAATTLEWIFSELLKNPRVLQKAQAEVREAFGSKGYVDETALQELKYTRSIIKETLRLHPPIPLLLPRECGETCEINGYTVPAGTQVFVNVWALGRDPKHWTDADEFYPERFLDSPTDYKGSCFEYIPFGAGKRICPGITFGLPNVELPLAQLLYYFDWKLPHGISHEDLDMNEALGTAVTRKNHLLAIPISYNPEPFE